MQLETHDASTQRILVVDDEPTNVVLLQRLLEWAGYTHTDTASDGAEAIAKIESYDPDLVILDLQMPGVDGYEVLKAIKYRVGHSFLPVLAYTADVTRKARERALSLGASDFLTKPGERTEIKLRIRNLLALRSLQQELCDRNDDLEFQVKERTRELEDAQAEIVNRLAIVGEFRDEQTGEHTIRVGELAGRIAGALGLDPEMVRLISLAARLHDIGKIGISDMILHKPARLTSREFESMKQHTSLGGHMLSHGNTPLLQMAEKIARTHHERFDGSGYPVGLLGTRSRSKGGSWRSPTCSTP